MNVASEIKWAKASPYNRFPEFISPRADRLKIIQQCCDKNNLNTTIITIEGNNHIMIFPTGQKPPRAEGSSFSFSGLNPTILVAHYDRVKGSPGANDNSIAVFHLLKTAITFKAINLNNWVIIFTDKEELSSGGNMEEQGSFSLAQKLRKWELTKANIYNFDTCGSGDTFVFSTTADFVLKDIDRPNIKVLKKQVSLLRNYALEKAYHLRLEKVILAPMPLCDDMGFLRAGLAAQTITMLPTQEAVQYEDILRKYPEFPQLLISGEIKKSPLKKFLPETWRIMNTPSDTHLRLTPEHFEQTVNFIFELCR